MSSVPFRREGKERNLEECRNVAARFGMEFGVQLHNTEKEETTDFLIRNQVPLSVHSPYRQERNWNFATEAVGDLWERVAAAVVELKRLSVTATLFHGFFMTDLPIPAFGHGLDYDECMRRIARPELFAEFPAGGVRPLNRNFTGEEEYLRRRETLRNHLARLRALHPEILFCIENDFPAYGAGSMMPEDLIALDHPVCFDVGHFWIASKLFGRDFQRGVDCFAASGRVKMAHLHAAPWRDPLPVWEWSDGHRPLDTPNDMNLPRVVRALVRAGVGHFVLEIPKGSAADVEAACRWIDSAGR